MRDRRVSDVMRSRDWYANALGFEGRLTVEDDDHVVGVVMGHHSGLTLGLHYEPALARALRGFCSIALTVDTIDDLNRCCEQLDTLGISHSEPAEGHLGWFVEVADRGRPGHRTPHDGSAQRKRSVTRGSILRHSRTLRSSFLKEWGRVKALVLLRCRRARVGARAAGWGVGLGWFRVPHQGSSI
jgi:catechol 2,3-dioxygenase-like lactoylglutathione lyase family enzyme